MKNVWANSIYMEMQIQIVHTFLSRPCAENFSSNMYCNWLTSSARICVTEQHIFHAFPLVMLYFASVMFEPPHPFHLNLYKMTLKLEDT